MGCSYDKLMAMARKISRSVREPQSDDMGRRLRTDYPKKLISGWLLRRKRTLTLIINLLDKHESVAFSTSVLMNVDIPM